MFPKSSTCPNPECDVKQVEEALLSRQGKLASFTVQRYKPPLFDLEPFSPYAIGLVELPEGINIVGVLTTMEGLKIGMGMELVIAPAYVKDGNEIMTWKFKPTETQK